MKLLVLFLILSSCLFSKDVYLNILHQVGGEAYIKDEKVYIINSNEVKLKRLQYYLTNFTLIDKNGNKIETPTKYLLINADSNDYFLGDIDIDSVASMEFYFGIEEKINHSDPSVWEVGHPLNLTYASMHWGWAAGYRFLAVEGVTKDLWSNWKNEFQFHLVGDQYYGKIQIDQPLTLVDSETGHYKIQLLADFKDLFQDVNLISNNFNHGSGGSNDIIATNVKSGRFLTSPKVLSVEKLANLSVYPNPTSDFVNIDFADLNTQNLSIQIVDINGNIVLEETAQQLKRIDLKKLSSGTYFVNILENSKILKSVKIMK